MHRPTILALLIVLFAELCPAQQPSGSNDEWDMPRTLSDGDVWSDVKRDVIWSEIEPRSADECGMSGSILERVQECNLFKKYDGTTLSIQNPTAWPWKTIRGFDSWALVTRTSKGLEYWIDLDSGQIWTPPEEDPWNWSLAMTLCRTAHESRFFPEARGLGRTWFLPSSTDYETAERHGIRKVLNMWPEPAVIWWTSTRLFFELGPRFFHGFSGIIDWYFADREAAVRCVLQTPKI
jgi:hypothetical protein